MDVFPRTSGTDELSRISRCTQLNTSVSPQATTPGDPREFQAYRATRETYLWAWCATGSSVGMSERATERHVFARVSSFHFSFFTYYMSTLMWKLFHLLHKHAHVFG